MHRHNGTQALAHAHARMRTRPLFCAPTSTTGAINFQGTPFERGGAFYRVRRIAIESGSRVEVGRGWSCAVLWVQWRALTGGGSGRCP